MGVTKQFSHYINRQKHINNIRKNDLQSRSNLPGKKVNY